MAILRMVQRDDAPAPARPQIERSEGLIDFLY
jgi:hypothetical protein